MIKRVTFDGIERFFESFYNVYREAKKRDLYFRK